MPLNRNTAKVTSLLLVCGTFSLLLLLTAAILTTGLNSDRNTRISSLVTEYAWEEALQDENSSATRFQAEQASTEKHPVQDTAVLSGISGQAEVLSDAIPVVRYKKGVVPAHVEQTIQFPREASVGDIISITTTDGKILHFKIIRRKTKDRDANCKDLDAPQKDTTLVNCMSYKSKEMRSEEYELEAVDVSSGADLQKRNVIIHQQL